MCLSFRGPGSCCYVQYIMLDEEKKKAGLSQLHAAVCRFNYVCWRRIPFRRRGHGRGVSCEMPYDAQQQQKEDDLNG
jgi:hypothetical protein